MKPRTTNILGYTSILIGVPGVVLPLLITFVDSLEQYLTVAMHIEFLANDDWLSWDLLVYPILFLPTNIIAFVMGILARRSLPGKAGIAISGVGLLMPIGAGLAVLMVIVMFLIWPPDLSFLFY
jgi:hypothetical protein